MKYQAGQRVIYTNPLTGEKLKATVLGYRPEYDIYCVRVQNADAAIVDAKDLTIE